MSYFTFDNKKIYYEENGSGTPLLFLHGNTASSKMFTDFSKRYTDSYKVILIDFLGHGRSERLSEFPADLWFYEAQQAIAFLRHKHYDKVNIIGCSGGAIVALNVALEASECVDKVIADSFEGEKADEAFVKNLLSDRSSSLEDTNARVFYSYMHGDDWEQIVHNDTSATNVFLNTMYGAPTFGVDTHVLRLGNRIGLAPGKTPLEVEKALAEAVTGVIPDEDLKYVSHWLVLHGRYICTAKKPACDTCPMQDLCPKIDVK